MNGRQAGNNAAGQAIWPGGLPAVVGLAGVYPAARQFSGSHDACELCKAAAAEREPHHQAPVARAASAYRAVPPEPASDSSP
jgi:predicted membrane-bound mannosyltransferase